MLVRKVAVLACGAILASIAGCSDHRAPEEKATATASESAAVTSTASTPTETPEAPASKPETAEGSKQSDSAKSESKSQKSNRVLLGTDELTSGIPGKGTLTLEEIKAWLADPANHEVLEVELPLGLNAGQGAIQGLDKTPLTRAKIELGRQLYFEPRLSVDGTVSCADCHHPDEGWVRHTQFGVGIQGLTGNRNSPGSYNRILSTLQFWDGRAASLEEQAVGPIENPVEMGNTHEAVVEMLKNNEGYRLQFEKIFPDGVTIDNVGRALASFERVVVTGPSPFDYYEQLRSFQTSLGDLLDDLDALKKEDPELYDLYVKAKKEADANPMSESAIRGRDIFFGEKGGCSACHVGPNLTDEKFHNLGVGMDQPAPDLGRYEVTKNDADRGAFKTPTIRNVSETAPYMHDGSQATLEEVVEWYDKGGHPNPHLSDKIKKLELTDQQKADLVAFMKEGLQGTLPEPEQGRLPK